MTAKKLFSWGGLAHKFAAVSRCATWSRASRKLLHVSNVLQRFSEQKVSLQEKKFNVSSRRIGVKWFHFRVTVVRDRKILPFPDCRILRIPPADKQRERKKEKYLLSPLPQGASILFKRQNTPSITAVIRRSLSFTLHFAYSSPAFSFSFSFPFSPFHICRHIQWVPKFIAFFKIAGFFFQKAVGHATWILAEKTWVAVQGLTWMWHFTMAYIEGRTYGRTQDGSDVITWPKFFAFMGLPISFMNGAPRASGSAINPDH